MIFFLQQRTNSSSTASERVSKNEWGKVQRSRWSNDLHDKFCWWFSNVFSPKFTQMFCSGGFNFAKQPEFGVCAASKNIRQSHFSSRMSFSSESSAVAREVCRNKASLLSRVSVKTQKAFAKYFFSKLKRPDAALLMCWFWNLFCVSLHRFALYRRWSERIPRREIWNKPSHHSVIWNEVFATKKLFKSIWGNKKGTRRKHSAYQSVWLVTRIESVGTKSFAFLFALSCVETSRRRRHENSDRDWNFKKKYCEEGNWNASWKAQFSVFPDQKRRF